MNYKLLLLLVVVVVATSAATGTSVVHSPPTLTEPELHHDLNEVQFEYYVLALTWPNSYCKIHENDPNPMKRCLHTDDKNLQQFFTIHGLWPTLSSGYSVPLSSCTPSAFNISNLYPKVLALANLNWPDVTKSTRGSTPPGKSIGFWEYEWDTHGICSNLEQNDYINLALNIYQKVIPNIRRLVKKHRSSNKTVDMDAFQQALGGLIGGEPRMVCENLFTNPHDQYLREIRFFVEKSAPYNITAYGGTNCGTSRLVYFP